MFAVFLARPGHLFLTRSSCMNRTRLSCFSSMMCSTSTPFPFYTLTEMLRETMSALKAILGAPGPVPRRRGKKKSWHSVRATSFFFPILTHQAESQMRLVIQQLFLKIRYVMSPPALYSYYEHNF